MNMRQAICMDFWYILFVKLQIHNNFLFTFGLWEK